jgi:acyl-coenzyme A thioesterase PaaI-like protein
MTLEEQQEPVRSSFAKQGLMTTLGATLGSVSPGMVEIALSSHPAISQQHGFVHAGAVSAIADTAAGYAALTLMPADTGILTAEFKINLRSRRRRAHPCPWARGESWSHPHLGPSGGVREYRRTRKADRSAHCHAHGCERA